MGYVFLAFSDASRDFALRTRNHLESARISTWLREPNLDREMDRALIDTALEAASVMLVVWRKTSENTSYVVQLRRELSQARKLNIPIIMLTNEEEFEPVIAKLKAMVPLQRGGAPLPIPILETDLEGINNLVAELQRPSPRPLITFLITAIGVVIFIGVLMALQSPGGTLNPFTATPSRTATASPTNTITATSSNTPTATPTYTPTLTSTFTPTFIPTDSATPTVTTTPTASPTPIPTLTPTLAPTHTQRSTTVNTHTLTSEIIETKSPFLTNTPSSSD